MDKCDLKWSDDWKKWHFCLIGLSMYALGKKMGSLIGDARSGYFQQKMTEGYQYGEF
jgi:hypothetical protein